MSNLKSDMLRQPHVGRQLSHSAMDTRGVHASIVDGTLRTTLLVGRMPVEEWSRWRQQER